MFLTGSIEDHEDRSTGDFTIEDLFDVMFYVECVNEVYDRNETEFDPITITRSNGLLEIEGNHYAGDGIVRHIEQALDERNINPELKKREVSEEIKKRLDRNEGVDESDLEAFKPLLGNLNSTTLT